VLGNPAGQGEVQEFRIQGASLHISKIEFSDPTLTENKAVRIHLSELQGKEFSRATIDLFLAEDVRPIYWQQGFLRVKLGPSQIRLSGNPNQKLPEEIPVYVPVEPGPVYRWQGALWSGNSLLSTITLDRLVGMKSGDVANGMQIEAAWDHIREQYGRMGHLDAKVDPQPKYDDGAHTVSYAVAIQEGPSYKLGKLILTGLSPNAEKRLRDTFPVAAGDVFDKGKYEDLLTKLETHKERVFGDLPLHYETVGHWLQMDPASSTVDVLLDFK
jgi:outer membrane protein assembly factor BamA